MEPPSFTEAAADDEHHHYPNGVIQLPRPTDRYDDPSLPPPPRTVGDEASHNIQRRDGHHRDRERRDRRRDDDDNDEDGDDNEGDGAVWEEAASRNTERRDSHRRDRERRDRRRDDDDVSRRRDGGTVRDGGDEKTITTTNEGGKGIGGAVERDGKKKRVPPILLPITEIVVKQRRGGGHDGNNNHGADAAGGSVVDGGRSGGGAVSIGSRAMVPYDSAQIPASDNPHAIVPFSSQSSSRLDPPDAEEMGQSSRRKHRSLQPHQRSSHRSSPSNSRKKPDDAYSVASSSIAASGRASDLMSIDDDVSRLSFRGCDPPEGGRGCDPFGEKVKSRDPPSDAASVGELPPGVTPGMAAAMAASNSRGKSKREIKGILRKKSVPAHAYFGKTALVACDNMKEKSASSNSNSFDEYFDEFLQPVKNPESKKFSDRKNRKVDDTNEGSEQDDGSVENDTNHMESTNTRGVSDSDEESDAYSDGGTSLWSARSAKTNFTGKSGLRSGKFASTNAAAATTSNYNSGDDESFFSDTLASSSKAKSSRRHRSNCDSDDDDDVESKYQAEEESSEGDQSSSFHFDRSKSHFLRTADLGLTQDTIFAEQFLDDPNAKPEPHYHHPSPHPPPGIQFHIDENWVCVDDGFGHHSPIAPQAVDALVAMGYRTTFDPAMWTPTPKTRKLMTAKGLRFDDLAPVGPVSEMGGPKDSECMCWSGKFSHKYHGWELSAIRSQGVVNMSPEDLVGLLMDSSRIKEYNKSSLGRVDELVLSDGSNVDSCPFNGRRKKKLTGVVTYGTRIVDGEAVMDSESEADRSDADAEGAFDEDQLTGTSGTRSTGRGRRKESIYIGVTKVIRSSNKPPIVPKTLEFVTLLHCRALADDQEGSGYIIVGRSITSAEDAKKETKGVLRSEVLLNVHIIRRLGEKKSKRKSKREDDKDLSNRCLLTNLTHSRSPLTPNLIAKKIGLSAATSFINDIRALAL